MATNPLHIRATTLDYLPLASTKRAFDAAHAKEAGLQALRAKATADGFVPVRGKESNWGMKASWTASNGKSVSYEMHIESHKGGKDEACLMTETLRTSDGDTTTYNSFLVAAGGNFKNVSEYYADSANRVRLAKSKWTRFRNCVKSRCVGPCLGSLVTCSGTWAAYLLCVAIACGGCMAVCGACALCNCKWWCKWAVGCCKD